MEINNTAFDVKGHDAFRSFLENQGCTVIQVDVVRYVVTLPTGTIAEKFPTHYIFTFPGGEKVKYIPPTQQLPATLSHWRGK